MVSVKQLDQMVKDLEALKQQRARMEGEYNQLLRSLNDLGYETVEQASIALIEMDEYLRTTGDDLDRQYTEFQDTFRDSLQALGSR